MIRVEFTTFRLIGIYMPNLLAKIPYWEALIGALSLQSATRALAIGDFNTCRPYLDEAGQMVASAPLNGPALLDLSQGLLSTLSSGGLRCAAA